MSILNTIYSGVKDAVVWILDASRIKLVLLTVFFLLIKFGLWLIEMFLPDAAGICDLLDMLPEEAYFFLDYFQFWFGLPLFAGAVMTRFLVRRIPFFG